MEWKLSILLLLTLLTAYRVILRVLQARSAGNPTPESVTDVYDAETYQRWRRYCAEKSRLQILVSILTYALTLILLLTNAYSAVASLFSPHPYMQLLVVVLFDALVGLPIDVFSSYAENLRIEEKYGFNRTTVKTFVLDRVRSFLLGATLSVLLSMLLAVLHVAIGDWLILLFAGALLLISLGGSFLYPLFSRVGNRFTPLEEGELKERLMGLLTKHGYRVKAIEVMDASRRTTKLNAYFTGFGRMKTIVLYDNLVNTLTPDEICAVFAHELGHGLHRDVLKQQILNVLNFLAMAFLVWGAVKLPQLHMAFGFATVNYGFAFILVGIALGLVQPLIGLVTSAYSRRAEYRADRQAVKEGYGEALITALKTLARGNFSHLSPSRLQVVLEYSHPPLAARIEAIERELSK